MKIKRGHTPNGLPRTLIEFTQHTVGVCHDPGNGIILVVKGHGGDVEKAIICLTPDEVRALIGALTERLDG